MSSFFVRRNGTDDGGCNFVLEPGRNLFTGEDDWEDFFGSLTSLESDLLLIGASVLAADRATERGDREDHARRIQVNVPVVNLARLLPLRQEIENILRILSNDGWRVNLRQAPGETEASTSFAKSEGRTLLFSGGLDSLAAALEFGNDDKLQLVSHKTRNQQTDRGQIQLVAQLKSVGLNLPHLQFFVSSRDGAPGALTHDVENSQRTRSFLFLILGSLCARRAGHDEILYLAENGQMAIHLPLTQGRIGSFSTHTAHPDFLSAMERFLRTSIELPYRITNPYVYKTKAEVIHSVVTTLPSAIPISNSCWRNARLPAGITHCGDCVPCFVRRISIEFWIQPDPTAYGDDSWRGGTLELPPDNAARRNMADLAEFIIRMETMSNEEIMSEWPELYSSNLDPSLVISMYRRFAAEARAVLDRYPALEPLLS
jgi:7-cyano-7-deazaguanine synthase in queuosine biosynthesis